MFKRAIRGLLLSTLVVFALLLWRQEGDALSLQDDFVAQVVALTNAARAEEGLPPLALNDLLTAAAQRHADAMAMEDFFDHINPISGSQPDERITETGYQWQTIAENIAAGDETPDDVVAGWLDSPGHRANILNPDFSEIGVGYALDPDDTFGENGSAYQTYWVQTFGTLTESGLAATQPATATLQATELVSVTIAADPEEVGQDEAVTVQITLRGDNASCGQSVIAKPLDVFLVLDVSGSMRGQPLNQAKAAARAFVQEIDLSIDRVGVATFDDSARLVHPLDTSSTQIVAAIDAINSGGGTAIDAGLQVALSDLLTSTRDEALPVIIILSDGNSDPRAAKRVADTAKAAEIKIVSVGLGNGVDSNLLEEIASEDESGQPLVFLSPDGSDLEQIYVTIARSIRDFGLATDLELRYQLGTYEFQLVSESLEPEGEIRGDTIIWEQDVLENGTTTFAFQVRPRASGEIDIGTLTEASFLECEQTERSISLPPGPTVVVESRDPIPPDVPTTCTNWQLFPWWLLIPLLLLLLFVLLLFLTPWGRNLWRRFADKPLLCKVLALLTLLYLLFLSAMLARALLGDLCRTDQVYFWRVAADSETVGIHATPFGLDGSQAVRSLNTMSECVACHTTNSNTQQIAASTKSVGSDNRHRGEIGLRTITGRTVSIPLINGSYSALSPDGTKLAFSAEDTDIHILEIATGVITPVIGASDPAIIETMPNWSPDGETLAFVRTTETDPRQTGMITAPSDIYIVAATGGEPLPLIGASGDGFNYYPAHSPDGNWIAFTRHTDGEDSYADPRADIYLIPATGGERIYLRANSESADSWPSWSPDSRWLGFNSNRIGEQFDILVTEINQSGQSSNVYRIPAAATDEYEEFQPVWITPEPLPLWQRVLSLWPWLIPLIPLLLLGWYFCRDRYYVLSGQVVDAMTGGPISGAELQFSTPIHDSIAADAGHYQVKLPVGSVSLIAVAPNYVSQEKQATIIDRDAIIDFRLYPMVDIVRPLSPPPPLPQWNLPPVWQPEPTLIIGLGGTGRHILTHIKKNLLDAGAGEASPVVRLIQFDTGDYELLAQQDEPISFAGISLSRDDVVEFRDDLSDLLRPDATIDPEISGWFPTVDYRKRVGVLKLSQGTQGRRPPSRVALVRDVHSGEKSELWQLLMREARLAVDDDKSLRVMIVGSVVGGFGSAIIADLAYLAHRAAEALEVAPIIEGYLATSGAFSHVTVRADVDAANTFATLRELERFQLAQGYPFRMVYNRHASDDPLLTGTIYWRLFNELFVFDTPPNLPPANEAQQKVRSNPAYGIFPAVADAVTLRLDKASRDVMQDYRSNVRGSVENEQRARARAVVGSLGTFAYRLPIAELIAMLQIRWARALIRELIMGAAEGDMRIDPSFNHEDAARTVMAHVQQFIVGLAGYNEPSCPVGLKLLGLINSDGWSDTFLERLDSAELNDRETETEAFAAYLTGAVLTILNGQHSSTVQIARAGKIGYAQLFLETLFNALRQIQDEMIIIPPHLSEQQVAKVERLETILKPFGQFTRTVYEQLLQQTGALSERFLANKDEKEAGVLELLDLRERKAADALAEMDAVLVRRYIHSEALLNRWYQTYLQDHPQLSEMLQRLYWIEVDGSIHLALRSWSEQPTVLQSTSTDKEAFVAALIELARYMAQEIWHSETLASVLESTALHQDHLAETVQLLRSHSQPLLTYDDFKANRMMWGMALAVNRSVTDVQALTDMLKAGMAADRQFARIYATDPYTLLVSQTADVIPLSAIQSIEHAEQVYRRWYGLLPRSEPDAHAEPTAVYQAERIALLLEQRMTPELRQAARILRPLIAVALDTGGVARLYALAYAAGWVMRRNNLVHINLPDGTSFVVTQAEDYEKERPERLFAVGMARFGFTGTNNIRAVQAAAQSTDSNTVDSWKLWRDSNWQNLPLAAQLLENNDPDANDFATIVALMVRDELERRDV